MKKCPYCAEEIQDAAIKCKYCGERINKSYFVSQGKELFRTLKYADAVKEFAKAIELDSDDPASYILRACAYAGVAYNSGSMRLRRYDELALVDCNKAIDINPRYAQAYYVRAVITCDTEGYKDDNFKKALADCNMAIKIDPSYAVAYMKRHDINAGMNNYGLFDESADSRKAIELGYVSDGWWVDLRQL